MPLSVLDVIMVRIYLTEKYSKPFILFFVRQSLTHMVVRLLSSEWGVKKVLDHRPY